MPVLSVLTRDTAGISGIAGIAAGALRRAEAVLLAGGQQTARRNAWDAVCENRRLALDRQDPLDVGHDSGPGPGPGSGSDFTPQPVFEEPTGKRPERRPERRSPRLVVTR